MTTPTMKQMLHFHQMVEEGMVTRENFQQYLQKPDGWGKQGSLVFSLKPTFNPVPLFGRGSDYWYGAENGDGIKQDGLDVLRDPRSALITKVDVNKAVCQSMLVESDGGLVTGAEVFNRLLVLPNLVPADGRAFQAFWDNRANLPEQYKDGRLYFFDGDQFRRSLGYRCTPYFFWGDEQWIRNYRWAEDERDARCVSVLLPAKQP